MVQTEVEYAEKASKKEVEYVPLLGSRKYYLHLFNNDDYCSADKRWKTEGLPELVSLCSLSLCFV